MANHRHSQAQLPAESAWHHVLST